MADNQENILVNFDYQNIIIVDPNKVVDNNGKSKDRLVKHENLVMYANLEAHVLPRTKLAKGKSANDSLQTISVADINFLNPGNKQFLDNSYTDEITGKNTIKGEGANQISVTETKKNGVYRTEQTLKTNGTIGSVDNGLLGITNIEVKINASFLPSVRIELEDIKGRAMFEGGNNSPYAAFLNLPYPLFYLTLKGYYGKAVRYPLMLQSFNSRYDTSSGNFKISLQFYPYKYTIMSEIDLGYLLAVPHMYKSNLSIDKTTQNGTNFTKVENTIVERGYQKIKEVYNDYKSKGLIPTDFPELTVVQLTNSLDNFIKNVLDSFTKQNMDSLTNLDTYQNNLVNFQKDVFFAAGISWFDKYIDKTGFFVTNSNNSQRVYPFKKDLNLDARNAALSELDRIINEYKKKLEENPTLGKKGSYAINGKQKPSEIQFNITSNTLRYNGGITTIDLAKTYEQRTGKQATVGTTNNINTDFISNVKIIDSNGVKKSVTDLFVFDGDNSFVSLTNEMNKTVNTFRTQIQEDLTKALAEQIQNSKNGLGFIPTIRNILAVIFASGEAFLRLMDEVHTDAWNQRDATYRKNSIFGTSLSSDNLMNGEFNQPVYPWPQYVEEINTNETGEKYVIKYPGDVASLGVTKAYLFNVWPEVEFVEEFIRGFVERTLPPDSPTTTNNQKTETSLITLDAIEFPIKDEIYLNKDEVKYIYEIYERVILYSYYSKYNRGQSNNNSVYQAIAEAEATNVINSLSNDNPFLIKKLKNLNFNSGNFVEILKHISNDGVGNSWQNYIRGIFNSPYIKNYLKNTTQLIDINELSRPEYNPIVSLNGEDNIISYIGGTTTNKFDFTDTFPFTNLSWSKNNLANSNSFRTEQQLYNTNQVLSFNTTKKKITNYVETDNSVTKRPVTNFNYLSYTSPTNTDLSNLSLFYNTRANNPEIQFPTEGNVTYNNYSGSVSPYQTTSMLNTPYFINAIKVGVDNYVNGSVYPYREAAYLFLNSLPLATLREQYKTYEASEPLDYIFATMKKFGAIHKLPYAWVLKYGSIWHRYKTWKETGVDILDNVWQNYDYVGDYDPVSSAKTTTYTLNIHSATTELTLQKNTIYGSFDATQINTGFYPRLINYFNRFYFGSDLFTGYTSLDIQNEIDNGKLTFAYAQNSFIQKGQGFDSNNSGRTLNLIPWSLLVNNGNKEKTYLLPSHGATINQTLQECFTKSNNYSELRVEVNDNTSMYNGSVRLFWQAPNYGYFNNKKIKKPTPEEYTKEIFSGLTQDNFSLVGSNLSYSDIGEIFGTFEKDILDMFETEFLTYSKSAYDYSYKSTNFKIQEEIIDDTKQYIITDCNTGIKKISKDGLLFIDNILVNKYNLSAEVIKNIAINGLLTDDTLVDNNIAIYRNFQIFMRNSMIVVNPTGKTGSDIIIDAQNKQSINFIDSINGFMGYDTVLKYGNPSNFDVRLFNTFSSNSDIIQYEYKGYYEASNDSLPVSGGTITLGASLVQYPDAWTALYTHVGFSKIPQLVYSDNGSYITDFFIDMDIEFSEANVILFAPIIKIYATQKLINENMSKSQFTDIMTVYLNNCESFDNNIINSLMILVRKALPNVNDSPTGRIDTELEGPQAKVELWETFKALNDKWISGTDFKTKTLFEDVMIMDRASRNIGDKVLCDLYKIKSLLTNPNTKMSMLNLIQSILIDHNFIVFNTPSYVNFYNVQDAQKNPIPNIDSTTDFANMLFGTFMSVDYRESGPKLVCIYGGIPSQYPNLKENYDFRYKDDGLQLHKIAGNPCADNLIDKNDWDKSNRVVGFNVDIGVQNQQIFNNFSVGQENGKATAESLQLEYEMANQYNGTKTSSQNISLYNLYKVRNYTCSVSMLGNALIQPTMYFSLNYVPMFSGSYMITDVSHSIKPGSFETFFTGVRQSVHSLPPVDYYIQTLKNNLLQPLITLNKIEKAKEQTPQSNNINKQTTNTTNSGTSGKKPTANTTAPITNTSTKLSATTNSCSTNLAANYKDTYHNITPQQTTLAFEPMIKKITSLISSRGYSEPEKLKYLIFVAMYLNCGTENGLETYANNFTGIKLSNTEGNWGNNTSCDTGTSTNLFKYFPTREYMCLTVNNSEPIPFAVFNDVENNITMLLERWYQRVDKLTDLSAESLVNFWITQFPNPSKDNSYVTTYKQKNSKYYSNLINKANVAIQILKGNN
jgi:hypothetical protein